MIRVMVVDDEELVRSGLRLVLGTAPDIEVVAVCGGGAAVATVLAHRPDVLLLDIRMPDVDGLTVLRRLHADPDAEAPRTAMLTTFDAEEYLGAALHAGAAGFLLKDTAPEQLVHAVRVLADGGRVLAPGVTSTVIGGYLGGRHGTDAEHRAARLTCRERQVLALVGEGLSNSGVAQRLNLAHGTVKDHVSALLAKLGGLNRVQAAVLADRAGLVGCLSAERPERTERTERTERPGQPEAADRSEEHERHGQPGQPGQHEASVQHRAPERHGTPERRDQAARLAADSPLDVPCTPGTPSAPDTLGTTNRLGAPEAPEALEAPEAPEAPEASGTSGPLATGETRDTSDTSGTSGTVP
ncbi:response regulator transcription factor [Streptomyces sp. NPDC006992]|uniref:response regulator transcription factor n=1 Tax=Streptomyces sp. NPDC006992 TaxID=3155601 RepID=UPI0033FADBA2